MYCTMYSSIENIKINQIKPYSHQKQYVFTHQKDITD